MLKDHLSEPPPSIKEIIPQKHPNRIPEEDTPTEASRLPSSRRMVGGRSYYTSIAYRNARNAELHRASLHHVRGVRARELPVQRILFQKLIQERSVLKAGTPNRVHKNGDAEVK